MADIKFSQFTNGGDAQVGDEVVGLRAGLNARFTFPGIGIKDTDGNYLFQYGTVGAGAANFLAFTNSLSASDPTLSAEGADAVIGINIVTKGGGAVSIPSPVQDITTLEAGNIEITANTISPTNTNGSVNINSVGSGDIALNSLKWMIGSGLANQAVITNGIDQLSYATVQTFTGSSTIDAIARFVDTSGSIKDSLIIIDNLGNMSGILSSVYNGATSGTATLHAPAIAGATDLTLPSLTGTLALTSDVPSLPLSMSNGGTGASLAASNGGIFYTNATTGAILAGTAVANQMLQSGANSAPAWSAATWPATTTVNQILFSSSNNTVGEITTSSGGVLITDNTGTPSMLTNPAATGKILQSSNLAASTWSTASYPSTAGANGTLLTSNGADIVNTSATYPSTTTLNNILFSSANNIVSEIISSNGAILTSNSTGIPSMLTNPGATGSILQYFNGDSTNWSTAIYPLSAGAAGTLLTSNGTDITNTSAVYPSSTVANQILYSSSTNNVTGLASVNSASLITNSTGIPQYSSSLSDGQIVIGSTGATPVVSNITAGTGVSISNGAGSITISATGGGLTWTEVLSTSVTMSVNNAYIANNASLVTLTLPSTAAQGSIVSIQGKGAGLFRIGQNVGQVIRTTVASTTVGTAGSLTALGQYSSIELVCITANTEWAIFTGPQGNFNII